jgi:hypothetical protein
MIISRFIKKKIDEYFKFINKGTVLFTFVSMFLCFYQIFNIGMEFGTLDKTLLLILTIVSALNFKYNYEYLKSRVLLKKSGYILVLSLCFYAAFALSGSYLLLNASISINTFIEFLLVFIWIAPIVLLALSVILKISDKKTDRVEITKKDAGRVFWISFFVVMLVGLIYVFIYNPAISSYDTVTQFNQALGLEPLVNWHTPFHTLIIRLLLSIYNHPTFVVLIQCLFFAFVVASGFKFLYSIGLSRIMAISFVVIFAFSPNNAIHLVTIWKDIPYAASLLWATILIAKLLFKEADNNKVLNYKFIFLQSSICMILILLLRQNGIVPFLTFAISILVISKLNKHAILAVTTSLAFIIIFLIPVSSVLKIQPGPIGGKYIGLGQDMIGVEKYGGILSYNAKVYVDILTDVPNYTYNPTFATSTYLLDVSYTDFIKAYLNTYLNNPLKMTKAILNRTNLFWDFTTGKDAVVGTVAYVGTMDEMPDMEWSGIAPKRVESNRLLTEFLSLLVSISVRTPFVWFFWRIGLFTFLMLVSVVIILIKRQYSLLFILMPILGQIVSLILSTGWSDYRYFWSIALVSIFFLIVTILKLRRDEYGLH